MGKFRIPRPPTTEEKEQLAKTLAKLLSQFRLDEKKLQAAKGLIEYAQIAVFDHYISLFPDYKGRVMVVIWDEGLDCYELYTWRDDGSLRRHQQHSDWFEAFTPQE